MNTANEIYKAYVESIERKYEYLNMPIPKGKIDNPVTFLPDGRIVLIPPTVYPEPMEEYVFLWNSYLDHTTKVAAERVKELDQKNRDNKKSIKIETTKKV